MQPAAAFLARMERWLWELTRHELDESATFHDEILEINLTAVPDGCPPVPTGRYRLVTRQHGRRHVLVSPRSSPGGNGGAEGKGTKSASCPRCV